MYIQNAIGQSQVCECEVLLKSNSAVLPLPNCPRPLPHDRLIPFHTRYHPVKVYHSFDGVTPLSIGLIVDVLRDIIFVDANCVSLNNVASFGKVVINSNSHVNGEI